MPLPTYRLFEFDVTAADKGKLVSTLDTTFDLEKNVTSVTGISLNADNRGTLWDFGSQRLEIGGREVFPENFPSSFLMSGISAPPALKFFRFAEPLLPNTGKLILQFRDKWRPPAPGQADIWQPYRVQILLEQTIGLVPSNPTPSR